MAKIAILGFGTVGSGVYEVLRRNAASVSRRAGEPVEVKYILDPKDFTGNPVEPLVVKSIDVILQDPEIRVVVETIGGTRFAYPYVKACLESGRSVCTSNKEMVATYGAELLALAKEHDCAFLFEASVGGGTPIITPMHQCLAANVITEVEGIVNGTTNFMLTKMVRESLGFEDALHIAQELGYAETKDPSDDVDGRDACRKIAILSSMVCGHQIYPQNIPTRLPLHIMCVWRALHLLWWKPSTATARWWMSGTRAAPTLWSAPTSVRWQKPRARWRPWAAA